mmetsp:Transcript_33304/g.60196  ORF Transcript_33304/g.60196 Transcript_33304/m.60196 type:complete len:183 (-) Transcript_33304:492-1040(-)|eukprot:CAMPEP_0175071766 /NCGR_PEP_ID=MMETSP0052_2-20121109/19446_1 /TAXON_ID=51329 ORGANISM="Polytomella parva, Strain SAG 63-3" /NCGR_SAMPLE_ID=MMETSP0052_2 /ASSEMBLY_ACC=CAM_ASM_000194 /LENGTH=182 /DNA_ID=CAMNT_0016339015 /DNA_START=36 /DNA_END=584 /DNA_ORIENTATION=+
MAAVKVTSVQVLNNPSQFLSPLSFEIEYECLVNLPDDIEWKIIYVGSAENEQYDQTLESVLVGPVQAGVFKFVFEANPPDLELIPQDDVIGVTAVMLTCSYRDQEFVRIGYYVNVDYTDEELRENPPPQVVVDKLQRTILVDHPRVTRFNVNFEDPQPDADEAAAEEEGEPLAEVNEDVIVA